uniref:Putative secreted protein n=1 Tax=Ixodes ricinus TaxID=34613 RepID=A0A6B0U749_IXORI
MRRKSSSVRCPTGSWVFLSSVARATNAASMLVFSLALVSRTAMNSGYCSARPWASSGVTSRKLSLSHLFPMSKRGTFEPVYLRTSSTQRGRLRKEDLLVMS